MTDPAPESPSGAEPSPEPSRALAFTPVPRLKDRADGWKPEIQRAFIEALAETGSVASACRMVGRSEGSAYALRRHPEGHEFRAAWLAAQGHGVLRLQDAVIDRALNGVDMPIVYHGAIVGSCKHYDNRLAAFILRNHLPDQYGADGRASHAIDARKLARLKKEWHREWLEESAEEERQAREGLERWLAGLHQNRLNNQSPAQRERQIAADAQARADRAAGWGPGDPYRAYAEKAAELLPAFIAEVEAEWPPLPAWAWDAPDDEAADALPPPPIPDHGGTPAPHWPEPPDEPEGPRTRTLKDDSWD